jgi:alkylation response protein AidB-like acyl-CoA dehydrogenase
MTVSVPEDVEAFRVEVRALLVETAGARHEWQYFKDRSGATDALYRELGRRGWLAVSWPTSVGGLGRAPEFEFALWDEMAFARAARPSISAGLIARSLIDYASDEQRARFLPPIATGEATYALGYSEPEAGSDLTGVRTRADVTPDGYVVTGEKRWTSDAPSADYLWLLCRTGPLENRSRGLTLLVVPATSPGIEISPILTLDGHELSEVRLTDVHVPVANRIGEEGQAWRIIQGALARERHLQVLPGRLRRDFITLAEWAEAGAWLERADVRAELADMAATIRGVEVTARRLLDDRASAGESGSLATRQKLIGTTLMQRMARLPLQLGDRQMLVVGEPFEFMWRECVMETIAAGTSEVVTDMIARRDLGLGGGAESREPRSAALRAEVPADNDEIRSLQAMLRDLLSRHSAVGSPFDRALWQQLGDVGILSLGTSGGFGGVVEMAAASIELGFAGVVGPILPTVFAGQVLPPTAAQEILTGRRLAAIAWDSDLIEWGAIADVFLAVDSQQRGWVTRPTQQLQSVATLAMEPWARGPLERIDSLGDVSSAAAITELAMAAYLVGAGQRIVALACAYTRRRRQFGKILAEFQAVSHPLATAYVHVMAATDLVLEAARELSRSSADGRTLAAMARLRSSDAALAAVYSGLQAFGGMGFVADTPVTHLARQVRQLSVSGRSRSEVETDIVASWRELVRRADLADRPASPDPPSRGCP